MKVLHIGKYYPPVVGGVETVTFGLAEGLNAAGIRTDVLCSQFGAQAARDKAGSNYKVMRMQTWHTVASTPICPGMITSLRRIMRDYDILHVHLPNPMANLAVLASGFCGKVVLHWHSDIIQQKSLLHFYAPLQAWLLRRADAIIATSPPYVEASPYLKAWRHKVTVIPIGINAEHHAADPVALDNLRRRHNGRRIVFALGRMAYYKGFGYLVDAARSLPDDVLVIIGGCGEMAAELQARIASAGLADKVQLAGKISVAELGAYFELADVFCLPSIARSEAFGVVLLEAMACGTPIIAANIPGSGVPWVNADGISGFNVAPGNATALAAALLRVLDDRELRDELGRQARQRFAENFTSERMVAATVQLYQDLCAP